MEHGTNQWEEALRLKERDEHHHIPSPKVTLTARPTYWSNCTFCLMLTLKMATVICSKMFKQPHMI